MHELIILTGASRGLGAALTEQLLAQGHQVLGLSRQPSAQTHERLTQWSVDLVDPGPVAERLEQWLAAQTAPAWTAVSLINNAGWIPPVRPLRDLGAGDLARALRAGLEAPMVLSAAFLRATRGWAAPRKVLNISSGLGRRAMASQAAYCAAKAGMDHFTRCLALEEALQPHGARVCSLAPGVIATDMQVHLRGAGREHFPDRDTFVGLHAQGQLASAADAAARVLAYLRRADFGEPAVGDVRG